MVGVSLGLAGIPQAHAWHDGIEAMRTLQDNTSGQVVRVKSVTTDCCTLHPMRNQGHKQQRKMVHNGKVYYCTRMAGHGQPAPVHHWPARVKPPQVKHHHQQVQQSVNAQRAKRQAMYAAKAKQKAQLLAQKRKQVQLRAVQKRKAVLLAQQKRRLAHQKLMQAQQRKRAAQLLQQKRKLQLLAQQRKQATLKRAAQQHAVTTKTRLPVRHYQPQPQRVVVKPQYQSSYQRYHYQQVAAPQPQVKLQQSVQQHDRRQWQRSQAVHMLPIQRVVKPQHHVKPAPRSHYRYSAQQSVVRHDAHHQARGWQRSAVVQSHGVRVQPQHKHTVIKRHHYQATDCGC